MSILDKLLDKRGIKNIDELTTEERAIFDSYKLTLSAKDVSVKNLEDFCKLQISLIQERFAGPPSPHDVYLKACMHVYLTLLKAIEAPKVERKNLEKYLIALVQES